MVVVVLCCVDEAEWILVYSMPGMFCVDIYVGIKPLVLNVMLRILWRGWIQNGFYFGYILVKLFGSFGHIQTLTYLPIVFVLLYLLMQGLDTGVLCVFLASNKITRHVTIHRDST